MKHLLIVVLIQFLTFQIFGQHEAVESNEHATDAPFHKISLITAISIITNNVTENSDGVFVVPTFGLNYDYFFNHRWGIGLHNDIVLQQYKVERHEDEHELIRQNPVAVCGVLSYKPHHRWTLLGGYGVELEETENISLFRFGIEYGIELKDDWEIAFGAEYDHKINTYSSFIFGIAFSKILRNMK
jgi:hypothetical protein